MTEDWIPFKPYPDTKIVLLSHLYQRGAGRHFACCVNKVTQHAVACCHPRVMGVKPDWHTLSPSREGHHWICRNFDSIKEVLLNLHCCPSVRWQLSSELRQLNQTAFFFLCFHMLCMPQAVSERDLFTSIVSKNSYFRVPVPPRHLQFPSFSSRERRIGSIVALVSSSRL